MRISAILIFVSVTFGHAQQLHHQSLYWLRYQNQLIFNDRWQWMNEFDNRRFIGPDVQHQTIIHSRIHYRSGRWDFASGMTFSWAYTAVPESAIEHPLREIRPVMEATYEIPFQKFFLSQRIRFDHRFFEEDRFGGFDDGHEYVMRIRYRIQGRIPIVSDDAGPKVSVRIADEIMVNTKDNFFDQQRFYFSGDFRLSKRFSVESGYIHVYQQRRGVEEFYSRNVLRLSLIHRIEI